jgi:hypothetical protein
MAAIGFMMTRYHKTRTGLAVKTIGCEISCSCSKYSVIHSMMLCVFGMDLDGQSCHCVRELSLVCGISIETNFTEEDSFP